MPTSRIAVSIKTFLPKNIRIEPYGPPDLYASKFEDAKVTPLSEWTTFYESPQRAIAPPPRCKINTGPPDLRVLGSVGKNSQKNGFRRIELLFHEICLEDGQKCIL